MNAFKRIGYKVKLKKLPARPCLKSSNAGIMYGEAQRITILSSFEIGFNV